MAGRHNGRWPLDDDHRSYSGHYRGARDGRPYDNQYSRPYARGSHRGSPPRQRYSSPPQDRIRSPHNGDDFHIRGASNGGDRDPRKLREDDRPYSNYRRGRSHSPRGQGRRPYRDRDHESYRSPSYESRSQSRSRSRGRRASRSRSPYFGGQPSREVMLEGLMLDIVEEDITRELKQNYETDQLDDVRVIREKQTKNSRGFGFIRFPTLAASKAFMERNYPSIYLYGKGADKNDEQAARVRIAFSRERDDRNRGERADGEWTCKICTFVNFPGRTKCHRCQAPQIEMPAPNAMGQAKPQYMNSGDSDASPNGAASQFLLIRSLEPSVTEDVFAKGVTKLYKPNRRQSPPANVSSKKSIAKVASTTGDANLGAKEGSLRRVLLIRDRQTGESWRYGFAEFASIDDAQAALIRYNSFEKFTISSKPVMADYIHAGVFVPVLNPSEDLAQFTFSPLGNPATKLVYWDEDAYASELVVSSGSPTVEASDIHARSAADEAVAAAEGEGLIKSGKDDAKTKKRKADSSSTSKQKKAVPAHLQFWSDRHAELHGGQPATKSEDDPEANELPETKVVEASTPRQSFANLDKKCCYLCSRQFKAESEVNKHERLSELHRNNLKNEALVAKAQAKMVKAGIVTSAAEESSEYRDRAKERRAAFGASKKVSLPLKKSASKAEEVVEDNAAPVTSKGASLLGKMGWSAGEGLGAHGSGITAPIATDLFVQGVGLGAQGGRVGDATDEAGRNTKNDYGDFLERTKDKAKERFEKMS